MPKLLQINVSANAGSTGKIAEQIGKAARAAGWKSIIAYGKRANDSSSELVRIGNGFDIIIHGIQTRLFDRHGLGSVWATKQLVNQLEDFDVDIVHLHNIHDYYINYKILFGYLKERNLPIVWTLHDCWPFTGHCSHFDFIGCDKWQAHCGNCPGKGTYPKSLWFDRSKKNYDDKKEAFCSVLDNLTLIPVSNWLEGFVRKSFLKDARIIETIHNGIDVNLFRPIKDSAIREKYNIPKENKIVLGVAAPWSKRKGLEDFIQLAKKLNDDFVIVLIGLSLGQLKEMPQGIIGIPRTENQAELVSLYSEASIFVNPTYEDNYPTTNLEALSCGTPVITYRTGGSPESITDNTGAVVEKGDIAALCEYIISKSKEIGDSNTVCREWAINNCNSKLMYERYMKIYESLYNNE